MIGRRWKCGNAWSLTILIGRGLDFKVLRRKGPRDIHHPLFFMCGCQGATAGASKREQKRPGESVARIGLDARGAQPEG